MTLTGSFALQKRKREKGKYAFNFCSTTYRYLFYNGQKWRWRVGGTLKFRDADLKLGGVSASNTNVGIVPLLNLYVEYCPTSGNSSLTLTGSPRLWGEPWPLASRLIAR